MVVCPKKPDELVIHGSIVGNEDIVGCCDGAIVGCMDG